MPSLDYWKQSLLELDDEYIFVDDILPKEDQKTSLATGLKVLTHLYDLAWETRQLCRDMQVADSGTPASFTAQKRYLDLLKAGFEKQKHALDNVPKEFDEWTISGSQPQETDPVLARQFEIMRANIRVTHLWLQSLIFEDIVSLSTKGMLSPRDQVSEATVNLRSLWNDRENICRQLPHVLYNISHDNLAPNGSSLVRFLLRQSSGVHFD